MVENRVELVALGPAQITRHEGRRPARENRPARRRDRPADRAACWGRSRRPGSSPGRSRRRLRGWCRSSFRKSSTKTSCFFGCARLRRDRVCTALIPDERLVHVHRVQQRLVIAGLELVRADEEAVRVLLNPLGDLAGRKAVQRRLAHLRPAELGLAGEGYDGLVAALALLQVVADGVEVLDRALDAVGDDHRPRRAADLVLASTCSWKWSTMISAFRRIAWSWPSTKRRSFFWALLTSNSRVVLHRLGQLVVAGHRRVVGQHVQDEALLDRLLHGVACERRDAGPCRRPGGPGVPKISSVLFLGVAVKAK